MKKIFAMILSMLILFLCSCQTGSDVSFDEPEYSDDYTAYRFSAYQTPPPANSGSGSFSNNPNYATEEHYRNLAECGFNYAIGMYEYGEQDVLNALALCEQFGVKFYAQDLNIKSMIFANKSASNPVTEAEIAAIKARTDKYIQSPAYAGVFAFDEPVLSQIESISEVSKAYKALYPEKDFFVNLNPGWSDFDNYKTYLETFYEQVPENYLSYDNYPLKKDGAGNPTLGDSYLKNLEIVANVAKENNIPFYVFFLTIGHRSGSNNYRTPDNYEDIAWQNYTSMAFGARGANTFTYWTSMGDDASVTHALIDYYGNKTEVYYSMQEVIKEVRSFEKAYMNFNWQNTILYSADEDYPNSLYQYIFTDAKSHERLKSFSATDDFILGTFKDKDGLDAFMLTNMKDPYYTSAKNEVTLTFNNAKGLIVYKRGKTFKVPLTNGVYRTTMLAGDGEFIVPIK